MAEKYTSFAMVVNGQGLIDMSIVRSLEGSLFNGIIEARNGAEAMSRLRLAAPDTWRGTALKAPPGAVLVSSLLDDTDPFELCGTIKKSYHDMFLLLVSTKETLETDLVKFPGSSFDELLIAPFAATELSARMELLFNHHIRAVGGTSGNLPSQGRANPSNMPQPGSSLGHFLLLEALKTSNGVAVYKALDKRDNRTCALKALFGPAAKDALRVEAFEREGRVMAGIAHPNVLSCKERGDDGGIKYLASEWVDGPSLEDYLLVRGVPPLETFLRVAKELALAMKALHLQGLIHRDVKLSNVLLRRPEFNAVLSDFGISLETDTQPDSGFLEGSRLYMAPELFEGASADIRSDIYSYGATMYHFLTGTPPTREFDGAACPPCQARLLRPETPEGIDLMLVAHCLAKSPADRYGSMEEVLNELTAIETKMNAMPSLKSGYTVLAVDDEPIVLESLERLLRREPYRLICADSAEKALEVLASTQIHLLITDYKMPGMNGIELARIVRERSPDTIRIVFSGQADIEAVIAAINTGSVYKFLVKSWFREDLRQNIRLALEHYALQERNRELDRLLATKNKELESSNSELEKKVAERSAETFEALGRLEEQCSGLVEALFKIMAMHSEDMPQHGRRVGKVSKELALAAGASAKLASDIETAGYLHDIGKMALGIDSNSHNSKEEEARIIAKHSIAGARILESIPAFSEIAEMVRGHHERYDGQGIPDGLQGDAICFGARVIAIADHFDRLARVPETGIARRLQFADDSLVKISGTELDPLLLKIFLSGISANVYERLYASPPSAAANAVKAGKSWG